MKKSYIIWLVVIVVIVVVAGYLWWSSTSSYQSSVTATIPPATTSPIATTNPTASQTPTPTPSPAASFHAITLNTSGAGAFGSYLSAANEMTLYQSTKDANNVSNCTGTCAATWPPYTVSPAIAASLTADPGITGKIGTIKRANGSLQVTYRGLPLYFFAKDMKQGDTKGEAVNGFTEVAP